MKLLPKPNIRKPFHFLLARHGESIWNKENRFTGWTNVPLTQRGQNQAAAMGKTLKNNKVQPHCIFTSDLDRCIETSNIIRKKMNADFDINRTWRLNEKSYGDCEGVCRDDVVKMMSKDYVSELRRSFFMLPPNIDTQDKYDFSEYQLKTCEHFYRYNLHMGESKEMVLHRILPYWYETIIPTIRNRMCPLIVTHKHGARVLLKYLARMNLYDFDKLDVPNSTIHHIKLNSEFFIDEYEKDVITIKNNYD